MAGPVHTTQLTKTERQQLLSQLEKESLLAARCNAYASQVEDREVGETLTRLRDIAQANMGRMAHFFEEVGISHD